MKRAVMFALLLSLLNVPVFAAKYASINTTKANIRTCAGTKCAVKWYAWKYTPLIMIKASADKEWVEVKDFEGFTGWVSASLLSPNGGMSAKIDLNVRSGPGTSNGVVCTVEKGYPLKYISKKGSWIEVEDDPEDAKQDKCHGWVYNQNLWGFFKQ